MKFNFVLTLALFNLLVSCTSSSSNKLKNITTKYIKDKVKNPSSYKSISFSEVDTTFSEIYTDSTMLMYKPIYKYSIENIYEIENSNKEKVKMTVAFHFDSLLNILETSPEGLNGDYGELTGNVYWKYNNYVGNKPDAGSTVMIYSLDTLREGLKYDAICDVMGNFKISKILSGSYLLIVNSKNTTDSPDEHLDNLRIYSSYLKDLFNYDCYSVNKAEIKEYQKLDSTFWEYRLNNRDDSKYYETVTKIEKQKMDLAEKIIDKFPSDFRSKINLYTGYSKKMDISFVTINENKTANKVIDFGITYY